MRAWVDVLKGRAVTGPGGEPVGNVQSVEVDTGTWRAITVRVLVDGAVATQLGLKRPLLGRAALDVPTDRLSDAGEAMRLAGGHQGVADLASAQGLLLVEHMQKRFPQPATRPSPEPAESAGGGAGAAAEE